MVRGGQIPRSRPPRTGSAASTVPSTVRWCDGSLYISDQGNSTVRRVDSAGIITTVAGTGTAGYSGDCGAASAAQLSHPYAIALHDSVLYIVDGDDGGGTAGAHGARIRMVVP